MNEKPNSPPMTRDDWRRVFQRMADAARTRGEALRVFTDKTPADVVRAIATILEHAADELAPAPRAKGVKTT